MNLFDVKESVRAINRADSRSILCNRLSSLKTAFPISRRPSITHQSCISLSAGPARSFDYRPVEVSPSFHASSSIARKIRQRLQGPRQQAHNIREYYPQQQFRLRNRPRIAGEDRPGAGNEVRLRQFEFPAQIVREKEISEDLENRSSRSS